MNTHWTDRLSDYLDGELSSIERSECDAHLAACEQCRSALEDLRHVIATARADVDRPAVTDLWPGILARIGADNSAGRNAEVVALRPRARQVVFTLPQLALAASLLIAISAGVAYLAGNRGVAGPGLQEDPIQAQAEPLSPAMAGVERANFADAQFNQAVADLEDILQERRDELDPRTVIVIERNLATIDQAIREARAALDGDPSNVFLNSYLADARGKKLDLLRRAMMISSPSGD